MKIIAVNIDDTNIKDVSSLNIIYKGDSPLRCGMPFFIPPFSNQISARMSFAVKLKRVGKFIAQRFANRYYDQYTIALDFTAEDVLTEMKKRVHSWSLANSFENSCAFGEWKAIKEDVSIQTDLIYNSNCCLSKTMRIQDYLSLVDKVIMYISQYYMLKIGDIIMLSSSNIGIESLSIGDNISIMEDQQEILSLNIK